MLLILLVHLLITSCGSNKDNAISSINTEKLDTKISPWKKTASDSVNIKKLMRTLYEDYTNIDNESLNNRYLSDTIFGDCIFYKLELAHLYERGDIYLLKNKILNKKVFTEDLMEVLRSYGPVRMENKLLVVPVKANDQEIESTTLYRFKVDENRLELKSVNCIG
ncbi:hypothetical protein D1818_05335 [Aquimarina sp. BL5]|uniref:hypothetical protein n=1 Tax=Aquimarina sp. BL5 TaxID=1714860 RepID=UPI000E4902BD|nr:hypothetical protein [Aquimarina sp. BL5]AXT50279.1 hypothetical protein D1818_05335 [Aquimarina sp. BL5]RKN07151.1 hypothetical protein D7036_07910 [Aquimarina sp. BL5]